MYLLVTSADRYFLLQIRWLWAASHGRDGLMLTCTSITIFSISYLLSHPALTSLQISGGGLGQRVSSIMSCSCALTFACPKSSSVHASPPWGLRCALPEGWTTCLGAAKPPSPHAQKQVRL